VPKNLGIWEFKSGKVVVDMYFARDATAWKK